MGVGTTIIWLCLLTLDAVWVALGLGLGDEFGVQGLGFDAGVEGVVAVAGFAVLITFIGVLGDVPVSGVVSGS